jgi:hypothetical protein
MCHTKQRFFRHLFIYAADFKHYSSGLNASYPAFNFRFTFTHTSFQGFGRIRMVWEYPNMHFSFAMEKMRRGNTTGLYLTTRNPASLDGLKPPFAESYIITPTSIAAHFAAHLLTVFNSFRH